MTSRISVLVVDDHTVVRKGICTLLSSDKYGIEVVGEAGDGREAVVLARDLQPHVILMDLVMPVKSGLEAIEEIRKDNSNARILVLTSHAEDAELIRAIKAGAMGYLLKDASPDELIQAIHSVALDRISLPPDILKKMLNGQEGAGSEKPNNDLTAREMDVLRCVSNGLSNKQIAEKLSVSTTTVRSHVSNILRKLNLENRTQLAVYAREKGLN